MNKKFSFSFKFLDRFKKNKQVEETENEEIVDLSDDGSTEDDFDPTTDPHKVYSQNTEENSLEEMPNTDEQSEEIFHTSSTRKPQFQSMDFPNEEGEASEDKTDPAIVTNTALLNPNNPPDEIVNLDDLVKLHREKIESGEDIETTHEDDHETDPGQFVELKSTKKIDELLEEAKVKQSFQFFSFKDKFKKFTTPSNTASSEESKSLNFSRFEWSQIVLKIFSPYNRHRVHALFIIALVGTFTYLIGKNGALILGLLKSPTTSKVIARSEGTTPDVINTTPEDITKVTNVNLFNAKATEADAQKGPSVDIDSIVCTEGEKPTDLPLKLMDTVVLQDSVKSVAAVQVRGRNELLNIREGEKLDSMAEVSKINRLNVVIKNLETGTCEYIGNNDDETAPSPIKYVSAKQGKALLKGNNPEIKSTGNNFKITKAYRNKMLANINQILTEAKAVQITNPDGTLSYKMTEVIPGSIYSQLNIQENDIITHINGKKIENLNELMSLLGRIKEIDQFQLTLKRNGMNENLEYNFE